MEYSCSRCGYRSLFKHHVKNHLKRQTLCTPVIDECKPKVNMKMNECAHQTQHRISPYTEQKSPNTSPDTEQTSPNTEQMSPIRYKQVRLEQTSPDTHQTSPDTHQTSPDTHQTSPDTHQTSPDVHQVINGKTYNGNICAQCNNQFSASYWLMKHTMIVRFFFSTRTDGKNLKLIC